MTRLLVLEGILGYNLTYIPKVKRHGDLFPYQQFPRHCEIFCCECVEIDAAGDELTYVVFAVPIRRTATICIEACGLMC